MTDLSFFKIVEIYTRDGSSGILNLAKNLRLCGNIPICNRCGFEMVECGDKNTADDIVWYCSKNISVNKKKKAKCATRRSYRKNTIFESTHFQIWQVLGFVVLWTKNMALIDMHDELNIGRINTLVNLAAFCRELVFDGLFLATVAPIGGLGCTVQIEESMFGKRKYQREQHVAGVEAFWVFGGIEEKTGKAFLIPVELRNRECLLAIIRHFILPGTTLVSDCWKTYDTLHNAGYVRLRVDRSIKFKDPKRGAPTNHIESTWRHAKEIAETPNRQKEFMAGYLAKYLFLKSCLDQGKNPSTEFCNLASNLYNGLNAVVINKTRNDVYESLQDDLKVIYDRHKPNEPQVSNYSDEHD